MNSVAPATLPIARKMIDPSQFTLYYHIWILCGILLAIFVKILHR
jgi:hypothetical protein